MKHAIYNLLESHMFRLTFIIALAFLVSLMGCVSIDKAIKVATKNDSNAEATQYALNQKHRLIVAENCAHLFPVAESEVTRGEEKTTEREEEQEGPVIPCEENGQPVAEVKCPPSKIVYRDTYRTDTIKVRDRAAEAALQEQLKATQAERNQERQDKAALQAELAEEKDKGKKQLWFSIIMSAVAVGLFIALVRK